MKHELGKLDSDYSMSEQRFTFGKYKGETVAAVLKSNPSYIVWVAANVSFIILSPNIVKQARSVVRPYNPGRQSSSPNMGAIRRSRYNTQRRTYGGYKHDYDYDDPMTYFEG